jgi:uncharacterized protein (UPF0332 family)
LELALGQPAAKFAKYFNTCRKKRNTVDYNLADVVTETELKELLKKAHEFRDFIEESIMKNYPQYSR